jgi:hypothetical protein
MTRAILTACLITVLMVSGLEAARAGPPFETDDPEPVDYRHAEIYIAGQCECGSRETTAALPLLELNYGVAPNVQLAVTVPMVFSVAPVTAAYGIGDVTVGVKIRFIQESRDRPQVAFYPAITFPTGNPTRLLGQGVPRASLPFWVQKKVGHAVVYGGTAYWHNPGPESRDGWYSGAVLEWIFSERVSIGVEAFHATPEVLGTGSTSGYTFGIVSAAGEKHDLLFSVGRTFSDQSALTLYGAYRLKVGPDRRQ